MSSAKTREPWSQHQIDQRGIGGGRDMPCQRQGPRNWTSAGSFDKGTWFSIISTWDFSHHLRYLLGLYDSWLLVTTNRWGCHLDTIKTIRVSSKRSQVERVQAKLKQKKKEERKRLSNGTQRGGIQSGLRLELLSETRKSTGTQVVLSATPASLWASLHSIFSLHISSYCFVVHVGGAPDSPG